MVGRKKTATSYASRTPASTLVSRRSIEIAPNPIGVASTAISPSSKSSVDLRADVVRNAQSSMQVDFPYPDQYLDDSSIQVTSQRFRDLQTQRRAQRSVHSLPAPPRTVTETNRMYADYHLCALHWWNDEKDAAVEYLTRVGEALPDDLDMQLQIVRLHITRQQFEEALHRAEQLRPRDHTVLRERETIALDLAVRLGDTDRAKKAAERLFGLRLGADEQLALASQMRTTRDE